MQTSPISLFLFREKQGIGDVCTQATGFWATPKNRAFKMTNKHSLRSFQSRYIKEGREEGENFQVCISEHHPTGFQLMLVCVFHVYRVYDLTFVFLLQFTSCKGEEELRIDRWQNLVSGFFTHASDTLEDTNPRHGQYVLTQPYHKGSGSHKHPCYSLSAWYMCHLL